MGKSDSKDILLETATRLFAEKGYHGVSIRELSSAAGVNVSLISYHFGGKENLYNAVLAEQFAVLSIVDDVCHKEVDTLKKFELYVRAILARYRENPYLLRFYTSELTNPTSCFEAIVKPAITNVIQNLLDTFSEGLSHKKFRSGLDPTDTVLAFAGMINFYVLLEPVTKEIIAHSPDRDEILIHHIMNIFTNGVLVR
jgi:TetR/AcrR family transcriptional regulator